MWEAGDNDTAQESHHKCHRRSSAVPSLVVDANCTVILLRDKGMGQIMCWQNTNSITTGITLRSRISLYEWRPYAWQMEEKGYVMVIQYFVYVIWSITLRKNQVKMVNSFDYICVTNTFRSICALLTLIITPNHPLKAVFLCELVLRRWYLQLLQLKSTKLSLLPHNKKISDSLIIRKAAVWGQKNIIILWPFLHLVVSNAKLYR